MRGSKEDGEVFLNLYLILKLRLGKPSLFILLKNELRLKVKIFLRSVYNYD